jgi:hypothetical protein
LQLLKTPYSTYDSTKPLISPNSQLSTIPLSPVRWITEKQETAIHKSLSTSLTSQTQLTTQNREEAEDKELNKYMMQFEQKDAREKLEIANAEQQEKEDKELLEFLLKLEQKKAKELLEIIEDQEIIQYLELNKL